MIERYKSTRKGGLGALMDLYEEEATFLIQTINQKVKDQHWDKILDNKTKDPDCRSIKTICQHMIGAANYYVELMKKGEDPSYKIQDDFPRIVARKDFEMGLGEVLDRQIQHLEGRWQMSDEDIEKIVIKTGWGNVLDPESLLEHAVMHIMRHHRQILQLISVSEDLHR